MSSEAGPVTPEAVAQGGWPEILRHYDDLAERPLGEVADWLRDWSQLEDALAEAAAVASIAYSTDTLDPEKERTHLWWTAEISPRAAEQSVRLARRLLASGHQEPGLETVLRRFRNQVELYRPDNLPLQAELSRLAARYQRVAGSMSVEWEGRALTVSQAQAKLVEKDRTVREKAYRLSLQPYVDAREELADLFDEMYERRQRLARNAGLANYRDFAHRDKHRFDYTPDDCLSWHRAVEECAVPAAERLHRRRRERLGVEALRPWDLRADPLGRPPLRPFQDAGELSAGAARIFEQVDPQLGRYYRTLVDEGLLDLDSRLGKAPGGYCTPLPHRRRPFIFMNAAGVDADVKTLMHEAGHAFHGFETMAALPLTWQRRYGSEMAEVASMSMELLSAPFHGAATGGFYDEDELRRARAEHLEKILTFFGHCAAVDAFQHWLYTDPAGADRDARDAQWLAIYARFERGVDFSGLEAFRVARWYSQLHFFQYPFYYIEYGIAQLGALQLWRDSLRDRPAAVARYRSALALGGSRPLPELYQAAGARLIFDSEGMAELIELCETELARLDP